MDNQAISTPATAGRPPPQGSATAWRSSLWLWPAATIVLAGIAGTLFGATGALLVGGEALASVVVIAGLLLFSRDRWLAIGMAAAFVAALAVFVGLAWLQESHHTSSHPKPTATATGAAKPPVDWQWRRISRAMAQRVNFAGANLDDANLAGLQLSHKNFNGAQADGASFRGSELEDASLRGVSLRGACLEGANLMGADLAGADLTGADVAGVKVSSQAKKAALVWPGRHSRPAAAC